MALGMELTTGEEVELTRLIIRLELPNEDGPPTVSVREPQAFSVGPKRLTCNDASRHLKREAVEAGLLIESPIMYNMHHLYVRPDQVEEAKEVAKKLLREFALKEVARRKEALAAAERFAAQVAEDANIVFRERNA